MRRAFTFARRQSLGSPTDAETVAFGAGPGLFITTYFGLTWGSAVATLTQSIFDLLHDALLRQSKAPVAMVLASSAIATGLAAFAAVLPQVLR